MTSTVPEPPEETRARIFLTPHRRSHGLRLVLASLVLIGSALLVDPSRVSSFESDIFVAINALPDWLFPPIWAVMQLGSFMAIPLVAVVAWATLGYRVALDVLIAGSAAWLLAIVVKAAVGRARPGEILADVIVRGQPAEGLGYVSGHTAVAAAIAAVLTPYLGRRWKAVVWSLAAIVGISRIYVGAHLPLDVLGGVAMGWGVGSLVHFLFGPSERDVQE